MGEAKVTLFPAIWVSNARTGEAEESEGEPFSLAPSQSAT